VDPADLDFVFCFMKIALPRAISPLGTCVSSSQRALCRSVGTKSVAPRVSSRQILCREQRALR
jgi:hypothetical protein